MPNIEIKARCENLARARTVADKCKTKYLGHLHQIDTYFPTLQGRLKLREITSDSEPPRAVLIPYSKSYEKAPTKSDYQLLEAKDPKAVKELFSKLLGTDFVVEKQREVFLIDNVRVHLDDVKDLGTFLEFEAVFEIDTEENRQHERRKVEELMQTFEIKVGDLVTDGYLTLLKAKQVTVYGQENKIMCGIL